MGDLALARWTAPAGHGAVYQRLHRGGRLSLDRPRQFPRAAPRGQDAVDLRYYDSWVPHPGVGISPAALFTAFRQAELGYPQLQVDILDDLVEGDGHARNLFEHRERVVAKQPLVVNAGAGDAESTAAAEALRIAMSRLPLKSAFEHLLRVNRYGYAGIELDWDLVTIGGRRWTVPTCLTLVPARRFRIGVQGMIPISTYPDGTATGETEVRFDDLRLYQLLEAPQGHPLRPGKWLTLRRQPSQVARGGLGRTAGLYMMAKRFSFRDWIVLSERYGLPWPVVTYKQGADDATLATANQIIQQLGNDGGAIVDDQLTLDIKDGVKAKTPMQDALIAFCNNEMSKLVNGSTLRNDNSGTGGGSYGLGNVHDEVAWDEVRSDGEILSEALAQQLVAPFVQFNALACAAPTMSIIVEPDLGPEAMLSIAIKLKNELGIEVSTTQLRDRTGARAPLNDQDKAAGMQVQSFPTGAGGLP